MPTKTKPVKKPKAKQPKVDWRLLEIFTLDEAAGFLRVTASVIEAEAAAGRLPGKRLGVDWRFSREALIAWLGQPGEAPKKSQKERILELAGCWADDPTVEKMVEDIYEERRKNTVNVG